jgi:type II secretory pathway pseudopilin PulG
MRRGGKFQAAERGYTMLSLLAAMTITLLVIGAAVPTIQHESQRHREQEFFFNGAQVAKALGMFYLAVGAYPTKLEDLTKPIIIPPGPKNPGTQPLVFHLRRSALVDPIAQDEWRLVRAGDPLINEFIRAHDAYVAANAAGGAFPPQIPISQIQGYVPTLLTAGVVVATRQGDEQQEAPSNFSLNPESRPILGVVSRSKKTLIRNYYGVEQYNECLFLAGFCAPNQGCRVLRMRGMDTAPGPPLDVMVMPTGPGATPPGGAPPGGTTPGGGTGK